MSDILTRLLLNTSDYDNKLKKAKGSTQNFASQIGSKAVAAVGKFAAGVGIAMGGVEAFNNVIQSSQTLGDKWNNTINACKGTVDVFFQSLATGNWDAFNQGLSETISNMYKISALKDMLEDAKLTMEFDTKKFEREYVRLEGIIDDETKSKGEREAAFAEMEALIGRFKERAQKTAEGVAKTLVAEMNAKFGQNFTMDDLEKYIEEVNNEFLDTETLQRLNKYKETLKLFDGGKSYSLKEYGGLVLTKDQYIAMNTELEKMRILQDDNNESRKNMLAQLEYAKDLYRQGDEYFKRSLEKKNKIASLNKGGSAITTGGGKEKGAIKPVFTPVLSYDNPIADKMVRAWFGEKFKPIEIPIVIEEENIEEEDIAGKWAERTKKIEEMNAALGHTGEIFSSLGGVMGSFGNEMGAWIMNSIGSVAQMVKELQSLATARGVAEAASKPFPFNLAAMATVVATVASIFSSLPKFADGGVVGGSSYFGDKLLARVNSGETILTNKMAGRALAMIDGGSNVRVSGDVRLNGKDIYISLRNYMSASGNKL